MRVPPALPRLRTPRSAKALLAAVAGTVLTILCASSPKAMTVNSTSSGSAAMARRAACLAASILPPPNIEPEQSSTMATKRGAAFGAAWAPSEESQATVSTASTRLAPGDRCGLKNG